MTIEWVTKWVTKWVIKNRYEFYGKEIILKLSNVLTKEYGKGFRKSTLYSCCAFYTAYPEIFRSLIGKSPEVLSWTHYLVLLHVNDSNARNWYEKEVFTQGWSVRTLKINVETQYYYRFMSSNVKESVVNEMKRNTASFDNNKLKFIS